MRHGARRGRAGRGRAGPQGRRARVEVQRLPTSWQVTKKEELEKARGTLKASVRKMPGVAKCDVICCSYYDEKPFHMMGNTTSGVTVVEFYRKCFSTATQSVFWVKIRRLSLADLYNFSMNHVDRADQLRHYYRPDGLWMRMRKWWWSIFLWVLGQAKVNAYKAYKAVCKAHKQKAMSHLEFHVALVTTWCTEPKRVLEYKCVGGVDTDTPPADQGVRGARAEAAAREAAAREAAAREAEAREQEAAESPGAAPAGASATGAGPSATPRARQPGDMQPGLRARKTPTAPAAAPAGVSAGSPHMNDKKHKHAVESYALVAAEQHEVDFVRQDKQKVDCQICGTGRGWRDPGRRYQTDARFRCATCDINVCGPGCWKALHGYYKEGQEPYEPKYVKGKKVAQEVAAEEVDDEQQEADEQDD